MRKLFFLPVLFFSCIIWSQDKALNGSYKIVKAVYGNENGNYNIDKTTIIKIFKDGYWIGAFFNNQEKTFSGSGGGTYITKNGKYIETLNFYSWDSTAVGSTYNFNYKLASNRYFQEGKINSAKYQDYLIKEEFEKIEAKEPLQNNSLEGVWQLENANWGGEASGLGKVKEIKIYCYPRFAWAQYHPQTGQFIGAGGGTYSFDGKKLIEAIEYITYDMNGRSEVTLDISLDGKKGYHQKDKQNNYTESWTRLK